MLNSVILVGRLTKDPTVVETENKTKRTNYFNFGDTKRI